MDQLARPADGFAQPHGNTPRLPLGDILAVGPGTDDEAVDEYGLESFPAGDPPSSGGGAGGEGSADRR